MSTTPTTPLRPQAGGFVRRFGTGWFVIEFLKGTGPAGSRRIDPAVGATMTDIHFEYRSALHCAHARDVVKHEEEKRLELGLPAYSRAEHYGRLAHLLARIPSGLLKMRYSSFTRYCGHLTRLGWIEKTGATEPSKMQASHHDAPPRVFYRLTKKGWDTTPSEVADPIRALYHYPRKQRSAKRHRYYQASRYHHSPEVR